MPPKRIIDRSAETGTRRAKVRATQDPSDQPPPKRTRRSAEKVIEEEERHAGQELSIEEAEPCDKGKGKAADQDSPIESADHGESTSLHVTDAQDAVSEHSDAHSHERSAHSDEDGDSSEDEFGSAWQYFVSQSGQGAPGVIAPTTTEVPANQEGAPQEGNDLDNEDATAALNRILATERARIAEVEEAEGEGDVDGEEVPAEEALRGLERDAEFSYGLGLEHGDEAPRTDAVSLAREQSVDAASQTTWDVPDCVVAAPSADDAHPLTGSMDSSVGDSVSAAAAHGCHQPPLKAIGKGKLAKAAAKKRARAPLSDATDIEIAARKTNYAKKAELRKERKRKAREARQANAFRHSNAADASGIMIIIDTNIILAHLHFLRYLHALLRPPIQILVPKAVLKELDILKMQRERDIEVAAGPRMYRREKMSVVARDATKWLLHATGSSREVVIQRMDDEAPDQMKNRNADARILHFTLRLHNRAAREGGTVVLLSNDDILRLNARSEGITALSTRDVKFNPRTLLHQVVPSYQPPIDVQEPKSLGVGTAGGIGAGAVPSVGRFGFATYSYSAKQPTAAIKALPVKPAASYWPATKVSTGQQQPSIIGPDAEFARHRSLIQAPGRCGTCGSETGRTIKTTPTQSHHACSACLRVVCKGCWKATGCEWECTTPYEGKVCATMTCCAPGRAVMLFEVLARLDACFYAAKTVYKISTKDKANPKATQYEGDDALVQLLDGVNNVLPHPLDPSASSLDTDPHPATLPMLQSSCLPDLLAGLFTEAPVERWVARSAVYYAALRLVATLCDSPVLLPFLFTRLVKQASAGLRPHVEGKGRITWTCLPEFDLYAETSPAGPKALPDVLARTAYHAVLKIGSSGDSDIEQTDLDVMKMYSHILDVGHAFVRAHKTHTTALATKAAADAEAARANEEETKLASEKSERENTEPQEVEDPPQPAEMADAGMALDAKTIALEQGGPAIVATPGPEKECQDVDGAPVEDVDGEEVNESDRLVAVE